MTILCEAVEWHIDPTDLPDADTTVLIELDPDSDYSEPTFMGYYDGEIWRDVHNVEVQVIAWAHALAGTRGDR